LKKEGVKVDSILGHGGFFKAKEAGMKIMAAAMNAPVSVMETAGEGGAWGIALLASFMKNRSEEESLEAYLETNVFSSQKQETVEPDQEDVSGFEEFMKRYTKGLEIERKAVEVMK
jgi:sugar (pentulose or hexulose) kinase